MDQGIKTTTKIPGTKLIRKTQYNKMSGTQKKMQPYSGNVQLYVPILKTRNSTILINDTIQGLRKTRINQIQ